MGQKSLWQSPESGNRETRHTVSNKAQHVTIDELADASEQVLPDARAAAVAAHLDDCAACRELAEALARTCQALADEPVPPMPPAVFDRLQAVVAAESARRASGEAAADEREAAAQAAKRTALGTFGRNPAYGKKSVRGRRETPNPG